MSSVDINSGNISLGSHILDIYATDRVGNKNQTSLRIQKSYYTPFNMCIVNNPHGKTAMHIDVHKSRILDYNRECTIHVQTK